MAQPPASSTVRRTRVSQRRLLVDVLILGLAGAVASQIFTYALHAVQWLFLVKFAGYVSPGLPSEGGTLQQVVGPHGLWLLPLSTTIGGLLVGILATRFAPEAEGHGTDTVVRAFHRSAGFVRPRVPPIKLIASAITIGSGGSAGREGPIALVTAGLGSWYAGLTNRTDRERRVLLVSGMAAGLAAIFRSPVGTALFAIEVLYADMEFEAGMILYTMLASIVAYAASGLLSGWRPLFDVPPSVALLPSAWDYAWYLVLGAAAGVAATVLPEVFYRIRDFFRHLPIPRMFRPALGGLLTGLMALAVPEVVGGGYGWIQLAIAGKLAVGLLVVLVFAKMVALALTVASGGSGGVFAPSLFIGAMLGGIVAAIAHVPAAAFVIVGMAAVFAGAAHVPLATLMMVTEMTGGYTLLVPAALAVVLSYLVQTRLNGKVRYSSLYEAQVNGRADSPAHHEQHLAIALRILREHEPTNLQGLGELELLPFLRAGVPVELPGDRRLMVGVLKQESPFVGTMLGKTGRDLDGGTANVIAILRGERMLAPRPDVQFEAGDRLMVVTTAEGMGKLGEQLGQW